MEMKEQFEMVGKIGELAESLLNRYIDKATDNSASTKETLEKYLSFSGVQDDYVIFEGDEYWAFGGYENHRLDMPKEYLFGEEERLAIERKTAEFIAVREENKRNGATRVYNTKALNACLRDLEALQCAA